jgi:hypothetical protein
MKLTKAEMRKIQQDQRAEGNLNNAAVFVFILIPLAILIFS